MLLSYKVKIDAEKATYKVNKVIAMVSRPKLVFIHLKILSKRAECVTRYLFAVGQNDMETST